MPFLRESIALISSSPGTLVYDLVTLYAIQLILGMAFGHWNRHRREAGPTRLLVMGIGFFLTRALLMLVALLDRVGVLSPPIVLPPLERFLDFVTLPLVAWAFLPVLERHSRLGLALLLVTLLLAAGVYAAFATLWPQDAVEGIAYNNHWQANAWEFSGVAVLSLAMLAGALWRGADWGLLICLFGLWLAGHCLQIVAPTDVPHSAGWVRLANLAALPLLAGLVYRRALGTPQPPSVSRGSPLWVLPAFSRPPVASKLAGTPKLAWGSRLRPSPGL